MDGKPLEVHNMPFSPLRSEPRAAAGSKENLAAWKPPSGRTCEFSSVCEVLIP